MEERNQPLDQYIHDKHDLVDFSVSLERLKKIRLGIWYIKVHFGVWEENEIPKTRVERRLGLETLQYCTIVDVLLLA